MKKPSKNKPQYWRRPLHYGSQIIIFFILLFLFSCLLHGMIFSIPSLRDYAYRELSYSYLSHKITNNASVANIALDTAEYVYHEVYFPEETPIIDDNSWNVLSRGYGYCDQQSFLISALLEKRGIPARWVAVRNASGHERHAVVEVLVNDRWQIYDPLHGYVHITPEGDVATFEELCAHPELVLKNERVLSLKPFTSFNFTEYASYYCNAGRRVPIYGADKDMKRKLIDAFVEFHYSLFGNRYAFFFQTIYLKRIAQEMQPNAAVYFTARQYHIYQRYALAADIYQKFLTEYPDSVSHTDGLLFSSILLCDELAQYEKGIAQLKQIVVGPKEQPNWIPVAQYRLGRCYEEIGDIEQALVHYTKSAYQTNLDSSSRIVALTEGNA